MQCAGHFSCLTLVSFEMGGSGFVLGKHSPLSPTPSPYTCLAYSHRPHFTGEAGEGTCPPQPPGCNLGLGHCACGPGGPRHPAGQVHRVSARPLALLSVELFFQPGLLRLHCCRCHTCVPLSRLPRDCSQLAGRGWASGLETPAGELLGGQMPGRALAPSFTSVLLPAGHRGHC